MDEHGRESVGSPEHGEKERTRESEIQRNIDMLRDLSERGEGVDEADVRARIEALPEIEGFDWYHYVPGRMNFDKALDNTKARAAVQFFEMDTTRQSRESYAFASRYQQEPDADSLGENNKSSREWLEGEGLFMEPAEVLIADAAWFKETGTHLNSKHDMLCPSVTAKGVMSGGSIVGMPGSGPARMWYDEEHKVIGVDVVPIGGHSPNIGIRRVVTAETRIETDEETTRT